MASNPSIKCSVQQCKYNSNERYCELGSIQVGTHESNPTECQCVDCLSFELK
ncbi:DUF1540 domain-containing protein [Anaerovorax odorimutans]|uniref:DUF1540 domain-containing protein n=1 Tax=Anaerovorax odorimutans TaxID=109327 RepID=UPI0003F9D5DB|nr:DUF1540 domain-containing protein [Anaerovorax odorimutans]